MTKAEIKKYVKEYLNKYNGKEFFVSKFNIIQLDSVLKGELVLTSFELESGKFDNFHTKINLETNSFDKNSLNLEIVLYDYSATCITRLNYNISNYSSIDNSILEYIIKEKLDEIFNKDFITNKIKKTNQDVLKEVTKGINDKITALNLKKLTTKSEFEIEQINLLENYYQNLLKKFS